MQRTPGSQKPNWVHPQPLWELIQCRNDRACPDVEKSNTCLHWHRQPADVRITRFLYVPRKREHNYDQNCVQRMLLNAVIVLLLVSILPPLISELFHHSSLRVLVLNPYLDSMVTSFVRLSLESNLMLPLTWTQLIRWALRHANEYTAHSLDLSWVSLTHSAPTVLLLSSAGRLNSVKLSCYFQ